MLHLWSKVQHIQCKSSHRLLNCTVLKKEGKNENFLRLFIIHKNTWNSTHFSCPTRRAITIKTGNSSITLSVVSTRIIFTSEFVLFQCSTCYNDCSWIPCSIPFFTCQPRLNCMFITFNKINLYKTKNT